MAPTNRRRAAALAATCAVALTIPVTAAAGTLPAGAVPGDRLDPRLSAELERSAAADRVAVVVQGVEAGLAADLVPGLRVGRTLAIVDGFSARVTPGQARALAALPGVDRVWLDGEVHAAEDSTLRDFGATGAAALPATDGSLDGSGVGVCVVDTGVDPAHEQLSGRPVAFADFIGLAATAYDDNGHGTHVAAIALGDGTGGSSAAAHRGVAPAAALYAAKVLDGNGSGSDSGVVAGIDWCASQPGVRVINLSLAGPGGDGSDIKSQAVDAAVAQGKVVVAAAGNAGDAPGTVTSPGDAKQAVTVGSVSEWSGTPGTPSYDAGLFLAGTSGRGPTADGRTKPDVVAPGVTVSSAQAGTAGGYVVRSGTSMAAPYVAGAVALALEKVPAATPTQVASALRGTASDRGATGADTEYGAGLVDARRFVERLAGLAEHPTSTPVAQRLSGSVANRSTTTVPVPVPSEAAGQPLAVTVTVAGSVVCSATCAWSTNLDAELLAPDGTVVATSSCPGSGEGCGGIGRQEVLGIGNAVAGTYSLRVHPASGTQTGGSFVADVARGPVDGGAVPAGNRSPVADAGADRLLGPGKQVTFTLDAKGSYDPDGDALTYRWYQGNKLLGTARTLTLTVRPGTYDYRLVVSDPSGLTDDDTVRVIVSR